MHNLVRLKLPEKTAEQPNLRHNMRKSSSPFFFSEISVVAQAPVLNKGAAEKKQPKIRISRASPKDALAAKAAAEEDRHLVEKEFEFLRKDSERFFGQHGTLALFIFASVKGSEGWEEAMRQYRNGCADFTEIEFVSLSQKLCSLFGFQENKTLARFELHVRKKPAAWLEREWPFEVKFAEGARIPKKAQGASQFVLVNRPTMADFFEYLEFRFAWKFHRKLSQESPEVGFELGPEEQKLLEQAKKRLEERQSEAVAAQAAMVREFKKEFEQIRLQFGIERAQFSLP